MCMSNNVKGLLCCIISRTHIAGTFFVCNASSGSLWAVTPIRPSCSLCSMTSQSFLEGPPIPHSGQCLTLSRFQSFDFITTQFCTGVADPHLTYIYCGSMCILFLQHAECAHGAFLIMQPLPHTAWLYPNVCNLADVSAGHMPFLSYSTCGMCFFHQSSCMRCTVIGCHSVQDALRSLDRPLQQSAANLNSYLQGVSGLPLPVFPADTWLLNTYLDEVKLDQLCHNRS